MRRLMVRYKVKADRADENIGYVQKVFEELHRTTPGGLHYATFRLPDGVSFMHLAFVEDPANNPLLALDAFKAFSAQVADRCDEPPATVALTEVGSYGWFAGG